MTRKKTPLGAHDVAEDRPGNTVGERLRKNKGAPTKAELRALRQEQHERSRMTAEERELCKTHADKEDVIPARFVKSEMSAKGRRVTVIHH